MSDFYAVIGRPIAHSKSPQIHLDFAKSAGQEIRYEKIEGESGRFAEQVDEFRTQGLRGLNITAPFKLDAFAYATELSDAARLAGAVNCLTFKSDGTVRGDNFDGVGLVRDITHNLKVALEGKKILMLGAGGAARGALLPILAEKPATFAIVNRTLAHAEALCDAVDGQIDVGNYGTLDRQPYDVILNATSCSLTGVLPPVSSDAFSAPVLVYELAYGKGLTPFLALAGQSGARAQADGVGMLVEQAAEAFALWRGVRPETRKVIDALAVPLS